MGAPTAIASWHVTVVVVAAADYGSGGDDDGGGDGDGCDVSSALWDY